MLQTNDRCLFVGSLFQQPLHIYRADLITYCIVFPLMHMFILDIVPYVDTHADMSPTHRYFAQIKSW